MAYSVSGKVEESRRRSRVSMFPEEEDTLSELAPLKEVKMLKKPARKMSRDMLTN